MSAISASTSTPSWRRAASRRARRPSRPPSSPASRPTARSASRPSDMHFPNGSVITPDGKTLIVGETLGGVPDRLRHRRRRVAREPPGLGRHRPRVPDGICARRRRRDLDRQSHRPGVRADRRRRRGARGDRHRPALLRLHAGRRRRPHPVHADRHDLASPMKRPLAPKGKLLIATVDVPHAGLP